MTCKTGSVPCDREGWERVREADLRARQRSAFIRLAQGVVDAIWLDLGAPGLSDMLDEQQLFNYLM